MELQNIIVSISGALFVLVGTFLIIFIQMMFKKLDRLDSRIDKLEEKIEKIQEKNERIQEKNNQDITEIKITIAKINTKLGIPEETISKII